MNPWPGRRASVLEHGSPLLLSARTAPASKAPEDWLSPKAPALSPIGQFFLAPIQARQLLGDDPLRLVAVW